ncbi:MAG: efflux RND transporter periplasmic adaptor subunit [Pyrinomonadaceae bacterium]|nr:efflux RND transporter periplasmic adaptor subunit [Pyrinomonadaceae bacterium]
MGTRKPTIKSNPVYQPSFGARKSVRAFLVLFATFAFFFALVATPALRLVSAHGDEDHGEQKTQTQTGKTAAPIRTAERNVQTPDGQFKVRLRQTPPDPRAGEEAQFAADLSEQVEGGFGGGGALPLEAAKVTARVTTAAGAAVASNLATHDEGTPGSYGVHYAFRDGGEYKTIFDIRTSDNRQFSADFPVSIVSAPVNWAFWLGLAILILLSAGAIFGYYNSWSRDGVTAREAARKTLPVAIATLVFFALGTAALAYFAPPHERRTVAALPPAGAETQTTGTALATGDPALGGSGAIVIIPKESQLLFNIRTAPVEVRRIVSGLKVTGAVRARPDARLVISPPVSGRVFFNRGVTIGSVVGRGEQVGTIEQILGAPEQASLEGQRIQLRTAALEQQARQAEQNALAQQARTRLTQAQRELQRATNLLEVGAAPKKRVEEAQTAVKLAQQEVASAEQQARVAAQQVQLARQSVARVDPVRTFPLVSPVTGSVTDVKAVTGQQVEAGAELLSVVNLSTVLLEAQVFEKDLATVRDSRRATYTAAGIPGEVYAIGEGGNSDGGRLVTIGASVNPQTRTVPVIFEVPNPLNRLRDGMFVEITMDTSGGAQVLSVPKQAIVTEQGRTFVYIFKGGEIFEKRVVTLGSEGQDYYEIKSGVQAGERVVTEGIYQLRSTQPGA